MVGDRQLAQHFSCGMHCRDGDGDVSWLYDASHTVVVSFMLTVNLCSTNFAAGRQNWPTKTIAAC